MRHFGLIGKKLEHSFSANYFSKKFQRDQIHDASYKNFEIQDIHEFKALFESKNLKGVNITIPYKEVILPYLDLLDATSAEIGAVNCVVKNHAGVLKGYNTDAYGFEKSLQKILKGKTMNALILGTGGSSKAVQYVFRQRGIPFQVVSRNPVEGLSISYDSLDKNLMHAHRLIVNCTPLGTFPEIKSFPPIPYEFLTSSHLLFDLVYNPKETIFLTQGKARKARIQNGYDMLIFQADRSWAIWNEKN